MVIGSDDTLTLTDVRGQGANPLLVEGGNAPPTVLTGKGLGVENTKRESIRRKIPANA